MRPGPGGDENTEKRIANMERLFDMGKRWSKILSYVYDELMAEFGRGRKDGTLEERLAALCRTLKRNADGTKERKDFVKGIYCAWL